MELNIPTLKTPQELEQAIQRYRAGEWNGNTLFALWEAIRNSALARPTLIQSKIRFQGKIAIKASYPFL
ncbi:hypothetical protein [Egbenema bharatensis]|uniref:hypothetical protein n=1 Tax=Egbenema bharatensis TaxID=3463334 RepID=UPI003A8BD45E